MARGDGVVDVINIESQLAAIRSKVSTKGRKGSSSSSKGGIAAAGTGILDLARNRLHLDYSGWQCCRCGLCHISNVRGEGEADNFWWK